MYVQIEQICDNETARLEIKNSSYHFDRLDKSCIFES